MKVLATLDIASKFKRYGPYSSFRDLEQTLQLLEFADYEGVQIISIVNNGNISHDGYGNIEVLPSTLQDTVILQLDGYPDVYLRNLDGVLSYSNDGVNFFPVRPGNMEKADYDSNLNGIVDEAENLNDGTNEVLTADLRDHLDNHPTQGAVEESPFVAVSAPPDEPPEGQIVIYALQHTQGGLDENTAFLLHSDHENLSQDFQDSSGNNTPISFYHNPPVEIYHSTNQNKFGQSCLFCNYGYLYIAHADLGFDADAEICFDFWTYLDSSLGITAFSMGLAHAYLDGLFQIYNPGDNRLAVGLNGGNQLDTGADSIPLDQWVHLAVEKRVSPLRTALYVNGQQLAYDEGTVYIEDADSPFYINWIGETAKAFYDEIRIQNVSPYNGQNFIPPDAPYNSVIDDFRLFAKGYGKTKEIQML